MNEGPTNQETLDGGTSIEVQLRTGQTETIPVKQLPIEDYGKLLDSMDDEPAACALYTGKPADWLRGLTIESFEKIVSEGQRVNLSFFERWLQRRLERSQRLLTLRADAPTKVAGPAK